MKATAMRIKDISNKDLEDAKNYCIMRMRELREHDPNDLYTTYKSAVQYIEERRIVFSPTGEGSLPYGWDDALLYDLLVIFAELWREREHNKKKGGDNK